MKNLTRAGRKKAKKRFKPGDVVTWGTGTVAHVIVDVTDRGVVVDVTSQDRPQSHIHSWAKKQPDGRYFLLVLFDSNTQGPGIRCRFQEHGVSSGPVWHAGDMEPDKVYPLRDRW